MQRFNPGFGRIGNLESWGKAHGNGLRISTYAYRGHHEGQKVGLIKVSQPIWTLRPYGRLKTWFSESNRKGIPFKLSCFPD